MSEAAAAAAGPVALCRAGLFWWVSFPAAAHRSGGSSRRAAAQWPHWWHMWGSWTRTGRACRTTAPHARADHLRPLRASCCCARPASPVPGCLPEPVSCLTQFRRSFFVSSILLWSPCVYYCVCCLCRSKKAT